MGTRIVLVMSLVATVLALEPAHILRWEFLMVRKTSADEMGKAARDQTTPPARDPHVAVTEEYHSARQRGTAQALELFIARHPNSALAEKARAELRRMLR